MFLSPDYNLPSIYDIDLEALKNKGINALLFDLDSTLMGSKTGFYTQKTLDWLEKVKQDFFVGVVSNNNNPVYIEKVTACSDFPVVFEAHKPDIKVTKDFIEKHNISVECTAFVGDRPLTDILCGKNWDVKLFLLTQLPLTLKSR